MTSARVWRKSSYSGDNQGTCVEVNDTSPSVVLVRDSKDPDGPRLNFEPEAWSAFVEFAAAQQA